MFSNRKFLVIASFVALLGGCASQQPQTANPASAPVQMQSMPAPPPQGYVSETVGRPVPQSAHRQAVNPYETPEAKEKLRHWTEKAFKTEIAPGQFQVTKNPATAPAPGAVVVETKHTGGVTYTHWQVFPTLTPPE